MSRGAVGRTGLSGNLRVTSRSTEPVIYAATEWTSNSDLIADCARLGYLRKSDYLLDPTWGKGNWWTKWRPDFMQSYCRSQDGSDFRNLKYAAEEFDAIAFDPPYVACGGRATTGIPEMHDAYGLTDAPKDPETLQQLINAGLDEMHRLVRPSAVMALDPKRPNGIVLCKVQDYVSSGHLWPGTHYTLTHALDLGFRLWDRLEHISGPRPQPGGRRQVHARRNLSTLLILRKVPR